MAKFKEEDEFTLVIFKDKYPILIRESIDTIYKLLDPRNNVIMTYRVYDACEKGYNIRKVAFFIREVAQVQEVFTWEVKAGEIT